MSALLFSLLASTWMLHPDRALHHFVHRHWQIQDGLPQNSVRVLCQDDRGYLWIGTQEGLVRFDGVSFRIWHKYNSPALTNQDFRALTLDGAGRLIAGNRAGQLLRMDQGSLVAILKEPLEAPINALLALPGGDLLIGTEGLGLIKLTQGRAVPIEGPAFITTLIKIDKDLILAGSEKGGIGIYQKENWIWKGITEGLRSQHITAIVLDQSGALWLGTKNAGLQVFPSLGGFLQGRKRSMILDQRAGLGSLTVSAIQQDRDRNLWVALQDHGLVRMRLDPNRSNQNWSVVTHPSQFPGTMTFFKNPDPISGRRIACIKEDREGNMWFGTIGRGLHLLSDGEMTTFGPRDGLAENMVWMTAPDPRGGIWLSYENGALQHWYAGKLTDYTQRLMPRGYLANDILRTKNGDFWVGTDGAGLVRESNGEVTRFSPKNSAMRGSLVNCLEEDMFGRLWVGTYENGIAIFDPKNNNWSQITQAEGLPDNMIYDFETDRRGRMWVATGRGLAVQKDKDTWHVYTKQDGLPTNQLFLIRRDSRGDLWLTTETHGLIRYRNQQFEQFTTEDGLFTDTSFQVVEDHQKHLWFSSNYGIFRIRLRDFDLYREGVLERLNYQAFDINNGMKSVECNFIGPNSGGRDQEGHIWFPTIKGAVRADLKALRKPDGDLLVHVEQATYSGDKPIFAESDLPAGATNFKFHYSSPHFRHSDNIRFRYRLKPIDEDWVYADKRRVAGYSHLPHGNYTFMVEAGLPGGPWIGTHRDFRFSVDAFFFQKPWFMLFAFLALLGGNAVMFRWRSLHLEQTRVKLENQVQERTRELAAMNEEVLLVNRQLAENARLAGMAESATNLLHNVGNALNSALTSAELMIENVADESSDRLLQRMEQLIEKHQMDPTFFSDHDMGRRLPPALSEVAQVLIDTRREANHELQSFSRNIEFIGEILANQETFDQEHRPIEAVDINLLVEDALQMNGNLIRNGNIELIEDFETLPLVHLCKSDFLQIVSNLVKNACEAIAMNPSPANEHQLVVRTTSHDPKWVALIIQDSGVGVEPEHLARLFQYGFTTKPKGHGFGLHYCANVLKAMGGSIEATSEGKGKGTTFTLLFPAEITVETENLSAAKMPLETETAS
ncbi:sensor histidine kinase [Acanthopleuribacter pedis]|uniref:histidine kinase n=1 Tax=Acanthopleuribacter pedis TaxID=442870 RepID=A0A8J7Q270_9BACT|nr:sensor histidine kinase [Acanthopleuribacter pedis]MBO1316947.1 hypothetical protein [Acanthopleuribacter pedis]